MEKKKLIALGIEGSANKIGVGNHSSKFSYIKGLLIPMEISFQTLEPLSLLHQVSYSFFFTPRNWIPSERDC